MPKLNHLDLGAKFREILGSGNVYFQPPASIKMQYPAIRYSLKSIDPNHANDGLYIYTPCYEVILIDKNPNSEYFEKILYLPYCQFDRHYEADNLNHDVFTIYQH